MESKKNKNIVLIAVISAIMSVSIAMEYLAFDFGSFAPAGMWSGWFRLPVSGWFVLRALIEGTGNSIFYGIDGLFYTCILCILVPYIISVIVFVLTFYNKRSSLEAILTLSFIGFSINVVGVLFILPATLEDAIGIRGSSAGIRGALWHNLGLAWWILAIGFLFTGVLAYYRLSVFEDAAASADNSDSGHVSADNSVSGEQKEQGEHGFTFRFGEYNGASVSLNIGDAVVIGRSAKMCNIIIEDPVVSRKHCEVRLQSAKGDFTIVDYSSVGTYLCREKITGMTSAKAGDVISVGRLENMIELY